MPLRATSLVVAGLLLAAAEPVAGDAAIVVWMRVAEFGCLAAFCWYGLTRSLPRMQKNAQDEAALMRVHNSGVVDKVVARMEADRSAERETLHEMIRHCSQRGVGT